jgi:hypothetical protein
MDPHERTVPSPGVVTADLGHQSELQIEAGLPDALSKAVPVCPRLGAMPARFRRSVYSYEVYCEPSLLVYSGTSCSRKRSAAVMSTSWLEMRRPTTIAKQSRAYWVDHREQAQLAAVVGCDLADEVVGSDVITVLGTQADAGTVSQPPATALEQLQTLGAPDALNALALTRQPAICSRSVMRRQPSWAAPSLEIDRGWPSW